MGVPLWLENRAGEFRYALRMVRKTPGVTAIAVASLALGIGANTAIFSLVDAMLLKRLPVKAPEELYLVASNPSRPSTSWDYPDYRAFRDRNGSFTGLAAYSWGAQPLGMQLAGAGPGATAELAYTLLVSGNYFDVFGVRPAIGRLLTPDVDGKPGASPYAVLSYDYWLRRFAGDPTVIGRALRLNGYPFTIIGVAQRGFHGADVASAPDMFIPIMMRTETGGVPYTIWNTRNYWWLAVVGRAKPGMAIKQAEAQLTAIGRETADADRRARPNTRSSRERPVILLPAAHGYSYTRNRLEKPLVILMVVVGVVLLIACANLASLMLARGAARQRELAVRLALGSARSRLAVQLLAESMLIALAGGAAGLVFAYFGVQVLLGLMPQTSWMQVNIMVSPDLRLLGFTFAVTLLTGVLFGIAPALRSTRLNLVSALKEDAPGAAGSARITLRKALVVVQVALSLLLLVGAGLFARSLGNLRDIDLGFRSERTIIATIDPTESGYEGQRLRNFYERLRADTARIPGVQSVSLAEITPLTGSRWNGGVSVEGYQPATANDKRATQSVDMNAVSPRYFETVGIPMLLGRDFRDEDNPPYSVAPPKTIEERMRPQELPGPRVAVVNESFAKRFLAGRSPLGRRLCLDDEYDAARSYEIVGVVKDAHYFGLREAPEAMVYLPVWRPVLRERNLCVRTSLAAPGVVDGIRRVVASIDPAIPVLRTRTMEQQIDNDILEDRVIAMLSSFFGLLALLLAGIGLYGVISYSVARRTREIGIRMALGARRGAVLWLVLRDAALLVVAGAVIGIPAALSVTRLVKAMLFGVGAQDPATVAGGALVLAAVAALASFLPARRATRVEPITALRYE